MKTDTMQNPEEFITSAADINTTRSASVPPHGLLRTSGLSSHPPHRKIPTPAAPSPAPAPLTTPPERRPPERPARPRSASLPSLIPSKQGMEAVESAMGELGLQNAPELTVDAQNIGFAVTNGSNPKRRSRSVGASRDTEHRMSPIQWRRWRRRSDEIRYWRQSEDLTSLGLKCSATPDLALKDDGDTADGNETYLEEKTKDFNFGIPGQLVQNQEPIGLEERIITLEIKLMDFEYALCKLQAEGTRAPRQNSRPNNRTKQQQSRDSYFTSEPPQSVQASPALQQGAPVASPSKLGHDTTPKPRSTSVATTLRPSISGLRPTNRNDNSKDGNVRSSLVGLTIDHYTTLITLIRHEQSARVRLEQQVSQLQRRLDQASTPPASHWYGHSRSQHSFSPSLSSSQRRQGFVDISDRSRGPIWQQRSRSGSYSTTETDTDESAYHDVYVTPNITPVERGGYEREAFDRMTGLEEGMAF